MKTSKKWRKPLFRQPERRQGILPALFGARIGALLPSSSQWPLCATAKTASFHSPAQAKRRKITWMPLGPTPDAAPAIGVAEAVNGTKGGRKAPAARGGGNGFAPRAKPGPMAYGPGRLKPPAAGCCRKPPSATVARLPTCAQHRRPRRANLRVAPPCAQHLKDLLGAGDDVVLGLAGKHVEEGGIACHPDDQIPVLFRMDLGVQ